MWRLTIKKQNAFPQSHAHDLEPPSLLFLPLLQAHLLKSAYTRLHGLVHPPESPKWAEAAKTLNPAHRAQLQEQAEKEDEAAKAKAHEELHGHTRSLETFESFLAKERAGQDYTPNRPKIRLWFEPMTVRDYVEATAMSRNWIEQFLGIRKPRKGRRRRRAKPLKPDRLANEPFRYGPKTNFAVLGQWLAVCALAHHHHVR